MRLFTHNLLQCHVHGCTERNYPLRLEDCQAQACEGEYNPDFMRAFYHKLEWSGVLHLAKSLNLGVGLPEVCPEQPDDELLITLHKILFEHQIEQGRMVCEGCGHVYPIRDGIPNMLLAEDEVK